MLAQTLAIACQLVALDAIPRWQSPALESRPHTTHAAPSPLRLSLLGGHRSSPEGVRSYALLQLGMALPELLSPPEVLPPNATAPLPSTAIAVQSAQLASTHVNEGAPGDRQIAWLTVKRAVATVQAALRHHRVESLDRHLKQLAQRARYAAALPDLRLRGGSSADESLRLSPTLDDPARYTQQGARDLWFDAQLTWHLDRAIFTRDEIAIERLRRARDQDRIELVKRVMSVLKKWQKAQIELQEPLQLLEQRQRAQLTRLSAATQLDLLTDGWFSRHAPAAGSFGPP